MRTGCRNAGGAEGARTGPRHLGFGASVFPHNVDAYRHALTALKRHGRFDDAHSLVAEATRLFPGHDWPVAEAAFLALDRGDNTAAVDFAEDVRRRFPDSQSGYFAGLAGLRSAGRVDEAADLLASAMLRFPDEPWPLEKLGWFAVESGNFEAAIAYGEEARRRFPTHQGGYICGAAALRKIGRADEADAILARAMELFAGEAWPLESAAWLSREQGRWRESVERAEALTKAFPDNASGPMLKIFGLCQLKDFEQASQVANEAVRVFPDQSWPWRELAWIADERGAVDLSLDRWSVMRRRFPSAPEGYTGAIRTALAAGRFRAAEAIMSEAREMSVNGHDIEALAGQLLTAEDDWARTAQPAREAGAKTSQQNDGASETARLFASFESLAGTAQGCEFGLVQRAFGAEGIGLLRWSYMTGATLTAALENSFDGVGEPEQTELIVYRHRAGNEEYVTRDRRYHMQMHTFIRAGDAPWERVFRQSCRRLSLLKRKMIEDLRECRKIFVFKLGDELLAEVALDRLQAALQSYGDNLLLYVRRAEPGHPNGSVQLVRRGLVIGYLEKFSLTPDGDAVPPDTGSWLRICTDTHRLWNQHRQPQPDEVRSTCPPA